MKLQWIKRMGILSAVLFLMGGFAGFAAAKPMPEKPTWHDMRNELKKLKKHPKPVQIEKKDLAQKELKGADQGADIKPIQDDPHQPNPVLDPKAAHKAPHPNHAKGKELAPGQLKKADGAQDHANAKELAPGQLKKDKGLKGKADQNGKMKKEAPKPGKK